MLPFQSPGHSPLRPSPAVTPAATPEAGSPEGLSPATTPVHQILQAPFVPPPVRRQDRHVAAPLHPALLWAAPAHPAQGPLVDPVLAHNIQNLVAPLLPGHVMPPVPQHAIFHTAAPRMAAPMADPLAGILGGLRPVNAPRPLIGAAAPAQRRNRNLMPDFEEARRAAENEGLAPHTPDVNEAQRQRAQSTP